MSACRIGRKPQCGSHSEIHAGLGSAQPDLWHPWDEKPQLAITDRNRFASSTLRKRDSLVVSNFVAKATTGDGSGSSSTHYARSRSRRGPEGEHFARIQRLGQRLRTINRNRDCRFFSCSTIRFLETPQGQIPRRPRQARVLLGHPLEYR